MPRLTVVDPQNATGAAKELFDGPLKSTRINIFKGMANSPAALKGLLGLKSGLGEGVLSESEAEVIALINGEVNDCDYCVAAHTASGKSAGLTEDQTVAARKGDSIGDAKLDALAGFVRALHEKDGFASDEDIREFKDAGYGEDAIVEVIGHIAMNTFTNYFNHVNQTEVDFPAVPALA